MIYHLTPQKIDADVQLFFKTSVYLTLFKFIYN